MFLYTEPQTKPEKQHNKETLQLIENIRAKRIAEAAAGKHGFTDTSKTGASFFKFYDQLMNTKAKDTTSSNYSVWQGCLLETFQRRK